MWDFFFFLVVMGREVVWEGRKRMGKGRGKGEMEGENREKPGMGDFV